MTFSGKSGPWWRLMRFVCLVILPRLVEAYLITVKNIECLSEYVVQDGDMVSGNFVVLNKQFDGYSERDDIEMEITGPLGVKIMNTKARGGQKFEFKAAQPGHYHVCFFNPTAAPEKVDFSLHVGHIPNLKDLAKDVHFNPIETMSLRLRAVLERVSLEQQYYRAREVRHRLTNESTQSRLLWYTVMVHLALITCSVAQVFLVQRAFRKNVGYNRV